jgi:hypothetical protein
MPKNFEPFSLSHDAWGRLTLADADGRRHVGVEPVRAFPLSDPRRWIALVSAEGREVALVENLDELSPALRQTIEEELARREFVPVIERVISKSSRDPSEWEVITDRGPTTFVLKSDDDIRRMGPHRAMIFDAQGVRYLVDDARRLDAASRRILEHYF